MKYLFFVLTDIRETEKFKILIRQFLKLQTLLRTLVKVLTCRFNRECDTILVGHRWSLPGHGSLYCPIILKYVMVKHHSLKSPAALF